MDKVLYEDYENGESLLIKQVDDKIWILLWNELAIIPLEDFKNILKESEVNE